MSQVMLPQAVPAPGIARPVGPAAQAQDGPLLGPGGDPAELEAFADALSALVAELLGGKALPPPVAAPALGTAATAVDAEVAAVAPPRATPAGALLANLGTTLAAAVQAQVARPAAAPAAPEPVTAQALLPSAPVPSQVGGHQVPAAPPLPVPVGQPQWNQGMGERVVWMVNQHIPQATVRLNPAELGPVEIRLSVAQDQANVSFVATHATTREALEAAIPRLREMLAEQGLTLGEVNVSDRQPQEQHEGSAGSADKRGLGAAAEDEAGGDAGVLVRVSNGRLDIYA